MSTTSIKSRIARPTTRLSQIRPSILVLAVGIVTDAATTVYGISIMGLVYEGGLFASTVIPWLWRTESLGLNLGEAAGLYGYGYVGVGLGVAAILQFLDTDEGFQDHRFNRCTHTWTTRGLAAGFAISPVVNMVVLAKWIAYVPNAGWL